MSLKIYFDGSSRKNPGPASCACVLEFDTEKIIDSKYLGTETNNTAEYSGLLLGLETLLKNPFSISEISSIEIFGDSNLVIQQINDRWKCKESHLQVLKNKALEHIKEIKKINKNIKISFQHVPRDLNKEADKLANQCLDDALK